MSSTFNVVTSQEYKYGFVTDIEADSAAPGLSEDTIRFISAKKGEPDWLLEFRLKAYRHWLTMAEPDWAKVDYTRPDFQAIVYYSAPKQKTPKYASMDEVDPELKRTFEKLGVPISEQAALAGVAVDVVFDSVSVTTTYKEKLATVGIIFCSFSEAVREHPELIKRYLGSVVPASDNFYAALNSAVFTDGSFVFIPKGVTCPMDLSTYFRINNKDSGQFERTLIVAEEGASVSYLEGCTAPQFDTNQLHAAVVELVALDRASIKYSTVQNWYAGDKNGLGGIYNFVTKRGLCKGVASRISWTQVETGSAITWKYPSCILLGDDSIGEFYSVALTNHKQQADTGTKMVHIGRNTAIAGCAGIAGSARIGAQCTIGGGAIVLGHLEIADHVQISAGTLVSKSIRSPGHYTGIFPLDENSAWERNAASLKQLHKLRERIRVLESEHKK